MMIHSSNHSLYNSTYSHTCALAADDLHIPGGADTLIVTLHIILLPVSELHHANSPARIFFCRIPAL
jgi:hypothetical protein